VNGNGGAFDSLIKAKARIEPGHKIVLRYYGSTGCGNDLCAACGGAGKDRAELKALG